MVRPGVTWSCPPGRIFLRARRRSFRVSWCGSARLVRPPSRQSCELEYGQRIAGPGVVSIELVCANCHWRTVCGRSEAISRLRGIGLLRREPDPDDELLSVLMFDSVRRLTCPDCRERRLSARRLESDVSADDDPWQEAVLCETCRQPIAPERLEALPGVTQCMACQQKSEAGELPAESVEYCPNCGAPLAVRVSRGAGIARYKRFCTGNPPCRL
jgi:Prokaryotic dksA/traR C4-type zinc finger